jgi:hypothetical protein
MVLLLCHISKEYTEYYNAHKSNIHFYENYFSNEKYKSLRKKRKKIIKNWWGWWDDEHDEEEENERNWFGDGKNKEGKEEGKQF